MEDKHIKILFKLETDEHGYPPDDYESLWAKVITDKSYQIDNIPFFVKGLSEGDLIEVEECEDEFIFSEVINKSKITTLRVICFDESDIQSVREKLSDFGCDTEFMEDYGLVAVSVPSDVDYEPISKYLLECENDGSLEYEESALRH